MVIGERWSRGQGRGLLDGALCWSSASTSVPELLPLRVDNATRRSGQNVTERIGRRWTMPLGEVDRMSVNAGRGSAGATAIRGASRIGWAPLDNDDDGQAAGDLLGEAAAHAVEEPNHSWGGVIDDTRYGAWRSAGFP